MIYEASPKKLRDDSWGVRIEGSQTGSLNTNDVVDCEVKTNSGNRWERQVRIFWVDHDQEVALGEDADKAGDPGGGNGGQSNTNQRPPTSNTNTKVYVHKGDVQVGKTCPACHQMVGGRPDGPETFAGEEPF